METIITGSKNQVAIESGRPTVIIGERINPTGKKKLAEAIAENNREYIKMEAVKQIKAGANVLDVNVGIPGANEVENLPEIIQYIADISGLPICIDSSNPQAIEAALKIYPGKALVNSVTGEESSMEQILPLIKEHEAAVIALCLDEQGIPASPESRLNIANKVVERAVKLGIPQNDVLVDCLAMTLSQDTQSARVTLDTISLVKEKLGNNTVLGASNVSFGLPDRRSIHLAFFSIAIAKGLSAIIADPTVPLIRRVIRASDLLMGYDGWALNYIKDYRTFGPEK